MRRLKTPLGYAVLAAAAFLGGERAVAAAAPSSTKAPASEEIVGLPPLIVSDSRLQKLRWRYAEFPGYEVLSLCSDGVSESYLLATLRLNRIFESFAPAEFQVRSSVPTTMILFDQDKLADISRDMESELEQRASAAAEKHRENNPDFRPSTRPLPNLQLWDQDSAAICCLLREQDWNEFMPRASMTLFLAEEQQRFRLEARRPALPAWYVEGVLRLFAKAKLSGNQITLPPAVWITAEATAEIIRTVVEEQMPPTELPFGYALGLLPMETLLTGARPIVADNAAALKTAAIWNSQVEIFLRWALDDDWAKNKGEPSHRPGLWKYLQRVTLDPGSPNAFEECFGVTHRGMESLLTSYMFRAVNLPLGISARPPGRPPSISFHAASDSEISRVKGEWDRRTMNYVQAKFPAMSPLYAEAVRATLKAALKRDDRDPRFLATVGLFKSDTGETAEARTFLDRAVQAGVVRPRAYFELARLRYREALEHPQGKEGKLSAAQADGISRLLLQAREQQPALLNAYELLVQIWSHSESGPSREILDHLDAGARLFRHPKLIFAVALLEAHGGATGAAVALIDLGLKCSPDAETNTRLRTLRASLQPG